MKRFRVAADDAFDCKKEEPCPKHNSFHFILHFSQSRSKVNFFSQDVKTHEIGIYNSRCFPAAYAPLCLIFLACGQ